jgi:hypothetical protein
LGQAALDPQCSFNAGFSCDAGAWVVLVKIHGTLLHPRSSAESDRY